MHPNQAELIVGDQSGVIHLWDLRSDHNEQLVNMINEIYKINSFSMFKKYFVLLVIHQLINFNSISIFIFMNNYSLCKDTRSRSICARCCN